MNFGEKLQKLRRGAGMSQEELARQLDVSRQAVSRWELDGTLPDTGRVVALSRIFSVSTDYLLKEELESPSQTEESSQPPQPPAPKKRQGRGLLIAASITGGLGALGFLVIAVLSSMIEIWWTITTRNEEGGVTYTSGWTYSFVGFVEKYRLQALLWIFGLLLVTALLLLWGWWEKRRHGVPDNGTET